MENYVLPCAQDAALTVDQGLGQGILLVNLVDPHFKALRSPETAVAAVVMLVHGKAELFGQGMGEGKGPDSLYQACFTGNKGDAAGKLFARPHKGRAHSFTLRQLHG